MSLAEIANIAGGSIGGAIIAKAGFVTKVRTNEVGVMCVNGRYQRVRGDNAGHPYPVRRQGAHLHWPIAQVIHRVSVQDRPLPLDLFHIQCQDDWDKRPINGDLPRKQLSIKSQVIWGVIKPDVDPEAAYRSIVEVDYGEGGLEGAVRGICANGLRRVLENRKRSEISDDAFVREELKAVTKDDLHNYGAEVRGVSIWEAERTQGQMMQDAIQLGISAAYSQLLDIGEMQTAHSNQVSDMNRKVENLTEGVSELTKLHLDVQSALGMLASGDEDGIVTPFPRQHWSS